MNKIEWPWGSETVKDVERDIKWWKKSRALSLKSVTAAENAIKFLVRKKEVMQIAALAEKKMYSKKENNKGDKHE